MIKNYKVRLEPNNKQSTKMFQSAGVARWTYNWVLAKQEENYKSAQLTEEVKRADLYEPARLALVASGVTKPTKDQIDAKILQTPEYITTKETVARYSLYVKKLQYIVKAFEQRKDMIQQMGAEKRRQLDYENAIRAL